MAVAFGGGISLLALIAAAAGATATGGATAAARAFSMPVDFDAPAGCSDVEAFRRGVAMRLARSAGEPDVAGGISRLQVRIVRAGTRVQGELRLIGQEGATDTRRVEGTRCQEVVDVLALTAALALGPSVDRPAAAPEARASAVPSARVAAPRDVAPPMRSTVPARDVVPVGATSAATPSRAAAPPTPATATPSRPAMPPAAVAARPAITVAPVTATAAIAAAQRPTATAVAPPPADNAPDRPGPSGLRLEAGAGAAFAHVLAPGFNLGGAVMLGVTRRAERGVASSLRLMFLYLPDDLLLPAGDVTATWRALAISACPGWGLRSGALETQACARVTGGWLAATDRAVTNPRSASRSVGSAGVFLRGAATIGAGFSVELEAGLDAALVQRRFVTTTPLRTVADTPAVSVLVGLGLSRRL